MAVTTSQQISRYYQQFQSVDLTFTKEVARVVNLNPRQIFLKCLGYQWPCIIYSSSMVGAKVITNLQQSLKDAMAKSKNLVSLRYSFIQRDKPDPIAFFVSSKVVGVSPYGDPQKGLTFLTLQYTQRPPDDLIEAVGNVLEANVAAARRAEERIVIAPDVSKRLHLASKGALVVINNVPRSGLLRDISFGGLKLILQGVPQMLVEKDIAVRLEFDEPRETVSIPGRIVRFEAVQGRTDMAAFAVQFQEDAVPVSYKMRLAEFMRGRRRPKAE